jgi:hypothetical protein
MSNTMYVTNRTDKPLNVEYGCQPVCFPVNQKVRISEDAARHIFGYGSENKEPFMAAIGLIQTTNDIPQGLERLAKFEIVPCEPEKNHSLSPVVEQVPLPARRAGGKSFAAAP